MYPIHYPTRATGEATLIYPLPDIPIEEHVQSGLHHADRVFVTRGYVKGWMVCYVLGEGEGERVWKVVPEGFLQFVKHEEENDGW